MRAGSLDQAVGEQVRLVSGRFCCFPRSSRRIEERSSTAQKPDAAVPGMRVMRVEQPASSQCEFAPNRALRRLAPFSGPHVTAAEAVVHLLATRSMGKAPNPPIHGLGVSFDPRPNGKSYKARATFNGQLINLGRFKDAHSARLAFDQAVLRVRGVAAKLNYPPGTYQLNCKLVDEKVDAVLRKQAAAASQAAAVPENEKQQGAAAGSGADSHPQHDGPPQLAEQQQEQQVAPHGAWRSSLVPNGPPPQQLCAAACGAAACDALAAGGQAGVSDLDIDEGLLEQLLGEQCSDPSGLPGTPSALTASGDSGSGCWPLAAAGAATPWSPLLPPDWTDALPAAEPDDTAVLQLPALGVPRPPVFGSTGAGTSSSSGQSGCMPPAAAAAVLAGTAADSERAQQAGAGEPPAGRCSNSLVVAQAASGEPRTHEMVVLVRTRAIRAPPAGAAAATAGAQLVRASPTAPGAAGGSSSAGSSTVALTRGIAAAPQAAGPPAGPARQQQLVRMPASDVWVLLARARSHELPRSMRQRMHAMLLAHMRELFQQPLSIDGAEATAARLARKRPAPTC